jgi:hypothetical protein
MHDYTKREQKIIQLASNMRSRSDDLDAIKIAAAFFFRFDTKAYNWVRKIRGLIRRLMKKTGDDPLSSKDGIKMELHLRNNLQAVAGYSSVDGHSTENYKPLDRRLNERIVHAAFDNNEDELTKLRREKWQEAKLTTEINSEIERFSVAYKLLPSHDERLASAFSPAEVESRYQNAIRWILQRKVVPQFYIPRVRFIETKIGDGVKCISNPYGDVSVSLLVHENGRKSFGRWIQTEDGKKIWEETPPPKFREMETDTRVKIWAIYYLTKRGGGRLTEKGAIQMWHDEFEGGLIVTPSHKKNFQRYRKRILSGE